MCLQNNMILTKVKQQWESNVKKSNTDLINFYRKISGVK